MLKDELHKLVEQQTPLVTQYKLKSAGKAVVENPAPTAVATVKIPC